MVYESPEMRILGSVEELTLQQLNKVGSSADVFTPINENLVGSIIPAN